MGPAAWRRRLPIPGMANAIDAAAATAAAAEKKKKEMEMEGTPWSEGKTRIQRSQGRSDPNSSNPTQFICAGNRRETY